jgi:hypothetical protein
MPLAPKSLACRENALVLTITPPTASVMSCMQDALKLPDLDKKQFFEYCLEDTSGLLGSGADRTTFSAGRRSLDLLRALAMLVATPKGQGAGGISIVQDCLNILEKIGTEAEADTTEADTQQASSFRHCENKRSIILELMDAIVCSRQLTSDGRLFSRNALASTLHSSLLGTTAECVNNNPALLSFLAATATRSILIREKLPQEEEQTTFSMWLIEQLKLGHAPTSTPTATPAAITHAQHFPTMQTVKAKSSAMKSKLHRKVQGSLRIKRRDSASTTSPHPPLLLLQGGGEGRLHLPYL